MAWKDILVRQRPVLPERSTPAVEVSLREERMRPVVDKVLHDDHAGVWQRHRQRVVGLSAFQTPMFDADAVDGLLALRNSFVWLPCDGENVVPDLFVLLARN